MDIWQMALIVLGVAYLIGSVLVFARLRRTINVMRLRIKALELMAQKLDR